MADEKLEKCVSSIFHEIVNYSKKNELQIEMKQILLQKRQRCSSHSEYMNTLIRNIAYTVETTSVIVQILKESIVQKQYVRPQNYVELINQAQQNIRAVMEDQLLPQYREQISKGIINNQDLSAKAEMIYSTTKVTNDYLLVFMDIFMETSNAFFTSDLFNYSSERVGQVVLNTASFHAAVIFDGVSFG
ncbi:hypothetical protein HGO21_08375 [Acinetobacter sp. CUI P1]|uniref:hypothetical protein n=1 Tax=unclassified Paenibacillus TaxID=185978 RepID=UPI0005700AA2|nr:hypothetical protein [Paenibacillus sp. FSL H7-0357]MBY3619558.1 hypothetical protein [Acinetobacter sp. CUI P1]